MSGLYLGDNFLLDQWDVIMPEEGFVVEQGDLGGWGLIKVVGAQE